MKTILFSLLIIVFFTNFGQEKKSIEITKSTSEMEIDGLLSEPIWTTAQKVGDFWQQYPADVNKAATRTEVMLCMDDQNLYVGAICYDDQMDLPFTIQSLKRDFSFPRNDAFAIFIDPFKDQSNGFSFAVSPEGVQREGTLANGGAFGVTTAWDNKWFSKVTVLEDRWIVEMKIPFKSIRYKDSETEWGVNFARNNLKINETSVWNPVPVNFNVASLSYSGNLIWKTPPPKAGVNVSFIPYVSAGAFKDFDNNTSEFKPNIGFDAKIAISSSLNLDLTVNPDFSQIDVDAQVTNLNRFSIFFPEKRQFFIENSDLFSRFGFSKIRPFFSRKIGLDDNGQQLTILGGARLSGKLNKNWRIGLLNMHTEGDAGLNPENYTVATFQRKLFKASNISAILVNRQAFDNTEIIHNDYNRVVGAQFNLQSANSKYRGKAFYMKSFSPSLQDFSHASWLMRNTKNWTIHWNHEYVGKDFRTDVGFVPRIQNYDSNTGQYVYQSYWRIEPSVTYRKYVKNKKINYISPSIYWSEYLDTDFNSTESRISTSFNTQMTNKSRFGISLVNQTIKLLFDSDITFSGNPTHQADKYNFQTATAYYNSSTNRLLGFKFSARYGGYYTGQKVTLSGSIDYRIQPKFRISASFDQNEIWFNGASTYKAVSFTLIKPRIEYQFNKKMFFSTFIQYNTQRENININARFQYRFKPMSDLFIVYTDNYDANILGIKNRALVIKLVWWFNM